MDSKAASNTRSLNLYESIIVEWWLVFLNYLTPLLLIERHRASTGAQRESVGKNVLNEGHVDHKQ
jgi:hypothetical protein